VLTKKGYIKMIFLPETGVCVTERSHPKGVKRKLRQAILRSGVNLQGALNKKGVGVWIAFVLPYYRVFPYE
jgi:hypothetical protein